MYLSRSVYFFITLFISSILFSCKEDEKSLFKQMDASATGISFVNNLTNKEHLNILYYLYFYNGGGVAAGDINNDGLTDLYFTANTKGNNKLYLNKGNFQFEDMTAKAGVAGNSDWCSGVTMADVNGDGYLDIYVSAVAQFNDLKGHNELFINKGNGTFAEQSKEYALDFSGLSTQAAFFDYDKDGDLDCFLINHSKQPHANIVDTVNRNKRDAISGSRLFRNELNKGQQKFTDVSADAGIYQCNLSYGLGLSVADMNNDGWEDVYVGNDFHENDYYYINNKNGTFTESGAKHFAHYSRFSMGNDIADYNNDGQPDVITVDMLPPDEKTLKSYGSDENPDIYKMKLEMNGYQHQYSRNCLQKNNGSGINFSEVGLMAGISATDWSWAPLFADFDNDGKKDIFISSGIVKRPVDLDYIRFVSSMQVNKGLDKTDKYDDETIGKMPDGSSHPFFFKNKNGHVFADVSKEWGTANMKGYFNGAAYADLDNDGDLDIVTNNINASATVLKNETVGKNSLTVKLSADSLNRFGIGAKAYLFTKNGMQYQQLMLTRGFQSAVDTRLHFGLDSLTTVDSLLIIWPDQSCQTVKEPVINQQLNIEKKNAAGEFVYNHYFGVPAPYFTDVTNEINCNWKHNENDFFDFNVQYLIPHAQSTRGPKLAVADVNGDGLDDVYACGAKDQPGTLLVQQANGNFQSTNLTLFAKDAGCEDVDAVFLDADGNKTIDLLVISGGNQLPHQAGDLADRLYLNDGKGNFTRKNDAFTIQYENKSCVAVADVDHDGDMDFFVGNLASPTGYGLLKPSYLYLNEGKGKFTLASMQMADLTNLGIVTAADFADINNDGWDDLLVTGEWMPLKVFINNKGKFIATDVPASTGWWQTIMVTDVNADGHKDVLAGNWGHNSKLWERKNGPLKLYVKDFDNNGKTEQILAYTINGEEFPFLAKDELERALPLLKKAYLTYSEVAGKTVSYIFYDLFKDYKELKAETLSSSVFINDGKGGFKRYDLTDELQLAPVMSFASVGEKAGYVAGGNFYGVVPHEGRYDALHPSLFSFSETATTLYGTMPAINGEVRDMKWINTTGGNKLMVVARNNQPLLFLKSIGQLQTMK
ncbi:VCBS repeat-containing protein [Lacibacter sp. H375]|uniref:VCBS repeat-containing protein n=1 Tax=Lacibacter sp. H375 TaxID=3133424 RepID=UPI0030C2B600